MPRILESLEGLRHASFTIAAVEVVARALLTQQWHPIDFGGRWHCLRALSTGEKHADLKGRHGTRCQNPSGSLKSAMKTWLVPSVDRLLVQIMFLPSGLMTGRPSKPRDQVTRADFPVSIFNR